MRQKVHDFAYLEMHKLEETYWWHVSRRRIIEAAIQRFFPKRPLQILEAGCGTGGNLSMLSRHGNGVAIESNPIALSFAVNKGKGSFEIRQGALPDSLNVKAHEKFDLICLFDVLEHIERDIDSLKRLRLNLAPDGAVLLTVPAFQWLWSSHDDFNQHIRRYTKTQLKSKAKSAGFKVTYMSYFNFLLFGLALFQRKVTARNLHDGLPKLPEVGPHTNNVLKFVFGLESKLIKFFNFPFGLSVIAILRPTPNNSR